MAIHLRKIAVRAWLTFLTLLLGLFLILAVGTAFLVGTETGRLLLLGQVEIWLPYFTDQQFSASDVQSPSLGEWRFGRMIWQGGDDGPRVELEDVSLNWQPRFALQRRVLVDLLSAGQARARLPQDGGAEPAPDTREAPPALSVADIQSLWPNIPPIRIKRLAIDQLTVDQSNKPKLITSVVSEVEVNWNATPARLELHLAHNDSELDLTVALDTLEALRISGSVEAPSDSEWAQWVQWPLDEDIEGAWNVLLKDEESAIRLSIDTFRVPWRGYQLAAQGGVSYALNTERVLFSELDLFVDGDSARLDGFVEPDQADLSVTADRIPIDLLTGFVPLEDISGELSVDGRLSGGWRQPQFQGRAGFDGRLAGAPLTIATRSSATADALILDSLSANWGEASLTGEGRIGWNEQQLDVNLKWNNLRDARWQQWVVGWPEDLQLSVSGQAHVTGSPTAPVISSSVAAEGVFREQPLRLDAQVNATREQLNVASLTLITDLGGLNASADLNLETLALDARTKLRDVRSDWLAIMGIELPVRQDWGLSGELTWSGSLTQPIAEGRLSVEGRWQQRPLDAQIAIDSVSVDQLTLGASRLVLADTRTRLSGSIDWQAQRINLNAELTSLWLRTLRPFLPDLPSWLSDLTGNTSGTVTVAGPWQEPRVTGDLVFDGNWQSKSLRANLKLASEGREQWSIEQAKLMWGEARGSYQGELRPFEPALDGAYSVSGLTVTDLVTLPMLSLPPQFSGLSGTLAADGTITGVLTDPRLTAQASFSGAWQNTPLSVSLTVEELTTRRVAISEAQLDSGPASMNLSGTVAFEPLRLELDAELTRLGWSQIKPFLPESLDLPLQTLSGSLSGQFQVTGSWPTLTVEGHLNSEGKYLDDSYRLSWQGSGRLDEELRHEVSLTWGEADLEAQVSNQGDLVNGQLQLESFDIEQMRALGIPLPEDISGAVNADIEVAGQLSNPRVLADIEASGQWQPAHTETFKQSWRVSVAAEGRLNDWRISEGRVDLGSAGVLTLRGEGTQNRVDLTGTLNVPDTVYWLGETSAWNGKVAGEFEIVGTPEEPSIAAQFEWESAQWPIALNLNVDTVENQHRLNAVLTEEGTERLVISVATGQTPLAAWGEDLFQRSFNADIELNADPTVFEPIFQGRPDQEFTGELAGEFSIRGTLAQPVWQGQARLRQGRYENANYGTVLTGINATLTADNRTLQMDLTASDATNGSLSLSGAVVWPEQREQWWMPELDMTLNTRSARLLRRADIEATVSGELTVTGPWQDLTVAGLLDVTPMTIQLGSLLQSGTPTLNVVRPKQDDVTDAEPATFDFAPEGQWDVRLRADRRAQIYGQGLEAELSGEVDLTGELASPNVGGRFQVVRGIYTAFGKIFRISRGTVQVQGGQLFLDIVAVYEGPELRVELNVTGTQERLDLTLTSTPPLANEELLARLLFGKRIEEMTPVQALQLASALNSLRDPGGGLDLFGTTRDLLGLDTLTVDTATTPEGESGVNVAAGKYLSDRIFLEVESSVGAEQTLSGALQFQITPQVQLEVYSGGQTPLGGGGLQLNWSNDY